MAIYKWNIKVSWIWKSFNPENSWTEWQVLTKTPTGYAYCDSQWWDSWPRIDLVMVGWWWGGWGWDKYWYSWGWWWGGWVRACKGYVLSAKSYNVVIWAWWAWWCKALWKNWCPTCFWEIIAYWWGWAGNWCQASGSNWYANCWNWWWAWGQAGCSLSWAWWKFWWNHWWASVDKAWWGWGWAGSIWGDWIYCPYVKWWNGWAWFNLWDFGIPSIDLWAWWWWGGVCPWKAYYFWWNWNWCSACSNYWWGWGWSNSCSTAWWNWWSWTVYIRYPTDWSWWITCTTWGNCCYCCDWFCYVRFTSDWTFCIVC